MSPITSHILLVDDEPNVLSALSRIFLEQPYKIITASSAEEALQVLESEHEIQIIISDFRMPCMNGVVFLQNAMRILPDARRVILSAYTDSDVLLSAVNEGRIHRFIVKPWNNDELRQTVSELLVEYELIIGLRQQAEELLRNNRLLSDTNVQLNRLLNELLASLRSNTSNLPEHISPIKTELSPRELQIFHAIASGRPLKAIVEELGLSLKTVSTYKKRLSEKMGFKNDTDIIRYSLTHP